MSRDDTPRAPAPLPEAERRAWLAALDIPLWLPRTPRTSAVAASENESVAPTETSGATPAVTPAVEDSSVQPAAETLPPVVDAESVMAIEAESTHAVATVEAALPHTTVDRAATASASVDDVARMDWSALQATVLDCRRCGLCEGRTQAVFGVGHTAADLLIIGEAPGQEEDRRGEPFVGPAGQLLDRMLAAIGLDRQTVYITNVLKCRPPRNRDPQAEEALACAPFLRRQIELLAPRAILAVGRVSAQQLLETDETIGRLRGQWHRYGPQSTPLLVTYHPAYLLRRPGEKAKAWADLKQVRSALAGNG